MSTEAIKEREAFLQSLKVCAFIAKPVGLEKKFVKMVSELVDELLGARPEDQAPYIKKLKGLLNSPDIGRMVHMQFTVIALQTALNAGPIQFCKFWQSCLYGLPNEKFTL